jgi:hypothetical protein
MPSNNSPIACTLNAAALRERLAEIGTLGRDALNGVETPDPGHAVLRFSADPLTREHLEALVAAEAQCCAFMTFDLRVPDGELVLELAAPAGAEPVLDDLVAAFTNETPA